MARLPAGELENQVLQVVWGASEPVTARDVHGALSERRELAYTTVMTILVRLWKKGLLARDLVGRAFAYRAIVSREELAATRMRELLSDVGDPQVAFTHFVGSLPAEQVDDLRSALRQLPPR